MKTLNMPDHAKTWIALPHDPIRQLADNLWRVTGLLPATGFKRSMVIVRRTDDDLLIHSAMCLQDAEMKQIGANGANLNRSRTLLVAVSLFKPNSFAKSHLLTASTIPLYAFRI